MDNGSVHVGVVSPCGDTTVATRLGVGDGMLVGGVPFPSHMKQFSNGPSSQPLHLRVAPGDVASGSIESDDRESAPGLRGRPS